jgi:ribosomal protein L37AE/L43A
MPLDMSIALAGHGKDRDNDEPVCCVCEKAKAFKFAPELLSCLNCNRHFHKDCHMPSIVDS